MLDDGVRAVFTLNGATVDLVMNPGAIDLTPSGGTGTPKGLYAFVIDDIDGTIDGVDDAVLSDRKLKVKFQYIDASAGGAYAPIDAGNMTVTTAVVEVFEWDYRNRLTKVSRRTTTGAGTSYNMKVQTNAVEFAMKDSDSKTYTYDVYNQLIAADEDGTLGVEKFIYERGQVVSHTTPAGTSDVRLWGPGVDNLLADDDGDVDWTITDQQGTVTHVVDKLTSTTFTVTELAYDPFGKPDFSDGLIANINTYYAGREYDNFTDLYNNRSRWYDPGTRQFISEDPIDADINTYRYAGNSFGNATDPTGEVLLNVGAGVAGAGIGAVIGGVSYLLFAENASIGGFVGATLGGAAAGGITGLTLGASTAFVGSFVGTGAAGVVASTAGGGAIAGGAGAFVGSVIGQSAQSVIDTGSIQVDRNQVLQDTAFGAAGGAAGGLFGGLLDELAQFGGPSLIPALAGVSSSSGVAATAAVQFAQFGSTIGTSILFSTSQRNAPESIRTSNGGSSQGSARSRASVPRSVTRTNAQLVDDIGTRAGRWAQRSRQRTALADKSANTIGIKQHGYADRLLTRYQRMFGDRGLSTEVRYINGRPWISGDGVRGSVRLDVVEGALDNPAAVFDYKFGNAVLSNSRINQIRRIGRFGPNVPVTPIHP